MSRNFEFEHVGRALFIANRKISIFPGRFDLDDGGSQQWLAYFDPQIDPQQLTMRLQDDPYFIEPISRMPDVDYDRPVPFYSKERVKLFEFSFYYEQVRDGDRPFTLSPDRRIIQHPEFFLSEVPQDIQDVDFGDLLVRSAIEVFQSFVPAGDKNRTEYSMSLWIGEVLLSKLINGDGLPQNTPRDDRPGQILIASRGVGQ